MKERPDRPLSSDEMLEAFRREVAEPAAPYDDVRIRGDDTEKGAPSRPRPERPAVPTAPRAATPRPRPDRPRRPPTPQVQRKAVAASVALALIIFGLVAALGFARV